MISANAMRVSIQSGGVAESLDYQSCGLSRILLSRTQFLMLPLARKQVVRVLMGRRHIYESNHYFYHDDSFLVPPTFSFGRLKCYLLALKLS